MKTVVVINSANMGSGNAELGKTLLAAFLKKLWARDEKPSKILLYNSAVQIMTKSYGVLEALAALDHSGVEILGCGTCIDSYQIADQVAVGMVSNMEEIVNAMFEADKVITL